MMSLLNKMRAKSTNSAPVAYYMPNPSLTDWDAFKAQRAAYCALEGLEFDRNASYAAYQSLRSDKRALFWAEANRVNALARIFLQKKDSAPLGAAVQALKPVAKKKKNGFSAEATKAMIQKALQSMEEEVNAAMYAETAAKEQSEAGDAYQKYMKAKKALETTVMSSAIAAIMKKMTNVPAKQKKRSGPSAADGQPKAKISKTSSVAGPSTPRETSPESAISAEATTKGVRPKKRRDTKLPSRFDDFI